MRILLIAPLDPRRATQLKLLMGGESTYTRNLIEHPPVGVVFIYYQDALDRGEISYHPLYKIILLLQKLRFLPPGPRVYIFTLYAPYDLVYVHAHPLKLYGKIPPIVLSDSSSNYVFLSRYLNLNKTVLTIWMSLKKFIFMTAGIIDGEVNTKLVKNVFVFSNWAKKIKQRFGYNHFRVIYPGLPMPSNPKYTKRKKIRILFAGVWFERKGGRLVLEVFRRLVKHYNYIELTLLGQLPTDISIHIDEQIIHKDYITYADLIKCYRTHDILIHIPPKIEGYGMVVSEAMSYGMIPIISDICALPEFVVHKKSGLIVKAGSVDSLEEALTLLITNKRLKRDLSRGARERFITHFSLNVFHKKLKLLFNKALDS